jgi:RNA polymerase sigma-70 factor (ECF subfamily)
VESVRAGGAADDVAGDRAVVDALRAGDETAFGALVDRYYASMCNVARTYVKTREAAEDVVQETWAAIIQGVDRFEARSSLKTWMFSILVNIAKTRGAREARTTPFSSLSMADEPAVDPERFAGAEHRWAGFWASPPSTNFPEERALAKEAAGTLRSVIEQLPDSQRVVLTLRDVHGLSSDEVCSLLEISEGNQRVLLHRARSKARAALERYARGSASVTAGGSVEGHAEVGR